MSCSLNSSMLCYVQCNTQAKNRATPEKRIIVPVLCACMIALQGPNSGMTHVGMTKIAMPQQDSDAMTEHICIALKQLFSNFDLYKNLRG